MIVECLPNGMFGSNCYIAGNNGECVLIDAGVSTASVISTAEKLALRIKYVILTHAHIDHICEIDKLRLMTNAKLAVHESDAAALSDSTANGSTLFGRMRSFNSADILLKDGDMLEAGGLNFKIIHTPGHSPGCICIKLDNKLFTGDTLFKRSIGRTDLGNGSMPDIMNSINNKLMPLDDSTEVLPGHGESTTIGYERKNNPFL